MMRLLIVEDHEELWDFLSRRLQRRGFEVAVAKDGQEGLDKARELHPDVMLLDMNLPIVDGWTIARTLKSEPDTAGIPIIALTAHAMSGDKQKALDAGCNDYHPKPVVFAQLLAQIEAITGSTHASKESA
ncbi:response regulator transcription factor [Terriglobus aquaticus]|uniref:Response regulator transcription factor n=1 Tax=Terriglobus aquaticus TaxID=940139 RepID=A0ABW9KN30_9BACT|nr:response regulator [Terriglobus aquaticus]